MNILYHLVFLWILSGTPPTTMGIQPCALGCRDTTKGEVDVPPAYYRVYWHERPALAESLGMSLYTPSVFKVQWPRIVVAARYQWIKSYYRLPISMSDSLPIGRWYFITAVDSLGNESCMSNEVLR